MKQLLLLCLFLISLLHAESSHIVLSIDQNQVGTEKDMAIVKKLISEGKQTKTLLERYHSHTEVKYIDGSYILRIGPFYDNDVLSILFAKFKNSFPQEFIISDSSKIKVDNQSKDSSSSLWIIFSIILLIAIIFILLLIYKIIKLLQNRNETEEKFKKLEMIHRQLLTNFGDDLVDEYDVHLIEDVKKVVESEHELLDITGDLIEFLRLKSKKVVMKNEVFNFTNVLNEAIGTLSEIGKQKNIELIFDIDKDVPSSMSTNSLHLCKILVNMLEYSIIHTNSNEVKLTVYTTIDLMGGLRLKLIIDTDIKIEEPHKLFDAYYDEEERRYIGLGLFVAKELANLLGGEIKISNITDKKDSIIINIPIEDKGEHYANHEITNGKIAGKKILIVDQNIKVSEITKKQFIYFDMLPEIMSADQFMGNIPDFTEYDIIALGNQFFTKEVISSIGKAKKLKDLQVIGLENLFKSINTNLPDIVDVSLQKPLTPEYLFEILDKSSDRTDTSLVVEDRKRPLLIHREFFEDSQGVKLEDFAHFGSYHILLVEDNLVNQKVMKGIFSKSNMRVTVAENGQVALDILNKNPKMIDFIIMDINMPVMDGFVATEKIRSNSIFDHIPIVSLTALVAEHEIEKMFHLGVNGYLPKPIKIEKLYTAMETFLEIDSDIEIEHITEDSNIIELIGLDIDCGLKYTMYNSLFYREVLYEFLDAYSQSDLAFDILMSKKSYDEVRILCLDMKGITGTIGAIDMYRLVKKIHNYILTGKSELIHGYIQEYKDELSNLKRSIKLYLDR